MIILLFGTPARGQVLSDSGPLVGEEAAMVIGLVALTTLVALVDATAMVVQLDDEPMSSSAAWFETIFGVAHGALAAAWIARGASFDPHDESAITIGILIAAVGLGLTAHGLYHLWRPPAVAEPDPALVVIPTERGAGAALLVRF